MRRKGQGLGFAPRFRTGPRSRRLPLSSGQLQLLSGMPRAASALHAARPYAPMPYAPMPCVVYYDKFIYCLRVPYTGTVYGIRYTLLYITCTVVISVHCPPPHIPPHIPPHMMVYSTVHMMEDIEYYHMPILPFQISRLLIIHATVLNP